MGLKKAKTKSSIPTSNHPFMTWLANFLTQINTFITTGNAPDGFPYFSLRALNSWANKVVPAITDLQTKWTPVSTKGNHTTTQTTAFTNAKKLFLKNILRPWNKENVLYNSAFTVTNHSTLGTLPVSTARTIGGQTLEQIIVSLTPKGSCTYLIGCKTSHDASKHSSPDGMIPQFSFDIVARVATGTAQPAPPVGPEDCPFQGVDTHALFPYDFGLANAGKIMYIFFRWFDVVHPEKSGPWCNCITINLA
jgi:hypothetical protein